MLHDDAQLEGADDELDRGQEVQDEAEGEGGGVGGALQRLRGQGGAGQALQAVARPVRDGDHEEGHFEIYFMIMKSILQTNN